MLSCVKNRMARRGIATDPRFCNNFRRPFSDRPKRCRHNGRCFSRVARGVFLIEVFLRLGLALLLSMGLAVLLAWGWYSSERAAIGPEATLSAAASPAPTGAAKPSPPTVSAE